MEYKIFFDWSGFTVKDFEFLPLVQEGPCGRIRAGDASLRFSVGYQEKHRAALYVQDLDIPAPPATTAYLYEDTTVIEGILVKSIMNMGYLSFVSYIEAKLTDYLNSEYRKERRKLAVAALSDAWTFLIPSSAKKKYPYMKRLMGKSFYGLYTLGDVFYFIYQKGQDYTASCFVENGVELLFRKDASLHFNEQEIGFALAKKFFSCRKDRELYKKRWGAAAS